MVSQESLENWLHRVASAAHSTTQHNSPHTWLLKQSAYSHLPRLATLLATPWFHTLAGPILDVGAGTGALSLDLAWKVGTKGQVTAVDCDGDALELARLLADRAGVEIATLRADVNALPIESATQDTTVARFLFQHLRTPQVALSEMRRVTRPGGRVAIFDVDDAVKVCEPAEPQHLAHLYEAIRSVQLQRGGDRLVGRKLYGLMREAGLEKIQVIVIPRVQLGIQGGRNEDAENYEIERLRRERDGVINSGLISADHFESAISQAKQRFAEDRFEMVAEFVATGLVPHPE